MKKSFKQLLAAISLIAAIIGGVSVYTFAMTAGDFVIPTNVIDTGGTTEATATHNILTVTGQGSPTGISETTLYRMAMGYIYTLIGQEQPITRPTSLEIWRAGTNNEVTIKWQNVTDVDIYTLTPAYNENGTPESYYDYNGAWTKEAAVSGANEWTDTSTYEQRYYRVATKDTGNYALAPSGSIDAVGKFGVYLADQTTVYISTPLIPFNSCITYEIGDQASRHDTVGVYDLYGTTLALADYNGGHWNDSINGGISTMEIIPGNCYIYNTNKLPKTILFVGEVPDVMFVSTIEGGDPNTACAYIGRAFPTTVEVSVAGLNGSSYNSRANKAGFIGLYDNDGNSLNLSQHTTLSGWTDQMSPPVTFVFEPGRGYIFQEPIKSSFIWEQTL